MLQNSQITKMQQERFVENSQKIKTNNEPPSSLTENSEIRKIGNEHCEKFWNRKKSQQESFSQNSEIIKMAKEGFFKNSEIIKIENEPPSSG